MSELIGQVPQSEIDAWKAKYGKVIGVKVENHIAYLRPPDRKIISYASQAGKDPIKFNEILLNNCWLGGSEAIRQDDSLFLSASSVLSELIQIKEAELINF
ncbi:MAG: hypothetical protein ACK4EX_02450 [Thermaurantimonas sp.]|uniref:Uncharacterized protein n=1 Tax=Thermaurantimonas aggregans TaxID=2173829 RepID=A0A401XI22_9FLAO|nr:hypothetical protein [Thermaurantimonas aggregans]MCX8149214.1 hypothetical protein [Thermaurantimonas aggregans]GCD76656.1 hypothetical protein JCM31826_01380 [Thermaurantimonas aggregans]